MRHMSWWRGAGRGSGHMTDGSGIVSSMVRGSGTGGGGG
jgi:hypothetical protein